MTLDLPRLRPHQISGADALDTGGKILRQAPTGTGKSIEIITAAFRELSRNWRRVIIATPSIQLSAQIGQTICAAQCSIRPYFANSIDGTGVPPDAKLIITTHQSLWRNITKYRDTDKVFVDECHHVNSQAIRNWRAIEYFSDVAGCSATPWSEECKIMFSDFVSIYKRTDAIADGYCADTVTIETEDFSPMYQDSIGPDIWFYDRISNAQREIFNHRDGSTVIHSGNENGIAHFKTGRANRLICVGMGTEGFDCGRTIVRAVIARRLNSCILAHQMAGRARRPGGRQIVVHCGAASALAIGDRLAL